MTRSPSALNSITARRIPPIQCLLTFEALARLRSVTQTAEELCVTPSAVSHRVKQLEQMLGSRLFGRADFSLTTDGIAYLAHVREGLGALQRFPGAAASPGRRRLKLAVTPTFARVILIPRLRQFTEAYPEIDIALQVSIPLLDVIAEDADLMVRFGAGHYADVEHIELARDTITPWHPPASSGNMALSSGQKTLKACRCCAARWSPGAPGLQPPASTWPSPTKARNSTTLA